jgi:hypothetical protein
MAIVVVAAGAEAATAAPRTSKRKTCLFMADKTPKVENAS